MNIQNFIQELRRRNVIRVATAYAIAGWLIIQICATTFPYLSLPEWLITAVIVFVLIGFPLALIFAWAFELTPEGIKKSVEVDITESVTANTGKKLNRVIISVLSLAVFFLLTERIFFAESTFLEKNAAEFETASIAVLPFVNMSDDEGNEYFSDGLSEELLNGLAKLENIQVAGRTSSFQFKGSNPDLRDVGDQLGVAHILEGSVRKSGNRLRITAQLIQADNGFHLWSETYDRELTATDIFDIQEEITRMVVNELKIQLLEEEEEELEDIPTQDIEAYSAYLEATQLEVDRVAVDIEQAIEKYKEAIRLDPSFATAYARLAYAYNLLYSYGDLSSEDAKFLIRRNAEQALLLDENQGKAYHALSMYHLDFERDFEKAEEVALKGIELVPSDPFGYTVLSIVYFRQERYDESNALSEKAYELDPLDPTMGRNRAVQLRDIGKYEESLEMINQVLERNPDFTNALGFKVFTLRSGPYGRIDEAFKLMYGQYQKTPEDYFVLNQMYNLSRDLELYPLMESFQEQMKEYYPNNESVDWIFIDTHLSNNEFDEAEEIINAYVAEYGEDFRVNFIGPLSAINLERGEYQEWIDLVEKFHPELVEDNPIIDQTFDGRALGYARFLELEGQNERAEKIRSIALSSLEKDKKELEEKGLVMSALTIERNIAFHQRDYQRMMAIIDRLYFEFNHKTNVVLNINRNRMLRREIGDDPEFIELRNRIFQDVYIMRDEVISYLKEEGEWLEEWEMD